MFDGSVRSRTPPPYLATAGLLVIVMWYIFREIRVVSPPVPRLSFLTKVAYEQLAQQVLASSPSCGLHYVISLLLQLNIDASNDVINRRGGAINRLRHQHQHYRTLIRAHVLDVVNASVHPTTSLQLVQQMTFALYLITVSILSVGHDLLCIARYATCYFLLAGNNCCLP